MSVEHTDCSVSSDDGGRLFGHVFEIYRIEAFVEGIESMRPLGVGGSASV